MHSSMIMNSANYNVDRALLHMQIACLEMVHANNVLANHGIATPAVTGVFMDVVDVMLDAWKLADVLDEALHGAVGDVAKAEGVEFVGGFHHA